MKTNFAILFLCFILSGAVKSQVSCQTIPPANGQNSQYRFDQSCLRGDAEVYNYIPNPNMPELQFRVNFIFVNHPSTPTRYTASTIQQLTAACDSGLSYINRVRLRYCGIYPSWLTPPVIGPDVDTVKIKFIRNHVYEFIDTLGITKAYGTNKLFFRFPFDTANTVNVYFYEDRDTSVWNGAYVQQYSGNPYISFPSSPITGPIGPHVPGQSIGGDLLWHELAHAFGNLADHYQSNPPPRNTDPLNGWYSPDDSSLDSVFSYGCADYGVRNNNLMGNSFCRKVMSARQIAAFHYLVAKNRTKKYTQFNGLPYPYIPNPIPSAYSLNGTQTIVGSLPPFTILTIPTGADVTLNKLTLKLPANAKIIVQPGARLTMRCVAISLKTQPSPGINHWKGIEVWGIPSSPQLLNSNGTSNLQGVLNMENCEIRDAQFAILAGKRQPSGQVNNWNSGGGIIFAKNCNFIDNQIDVWMTPKPYGSSSAPVPGGNVTLNAVGNRSTFNYCSFVKTSPASWNYNGYDKTMVKLEGVGDVKFYDNEFYGAKGFSNWDTTYCIKGYNSNVIVQSLQAPLIKSTFDSTYYGIYMAGGRKNIIEDAVFYTRNGIYVSNSNYNKIVRNKFRLDFVSNAPFDNSLRTGIYMNESSKFKIEENELACGGLNSVFSEGICINNSGPEANQVYNNIFFKLDQGLWCQNVNYDANSLTYDGLKLNCNDFTLCKYDIGVQGLQYSPFNYCGIAQTQGLAGLFESFNVRNTYKSETAGGNQNKFYVQPMYSNGNQPTIIHGNFLDAPAANKFKVGPQSVYPYASNAAYVSDISGQPPTSNNKIDYCPNSSVLPASRGALNANLTAVNHQLTTQLTLFYASLDGGNTQHLLDLINNHLLNSVQLKDTLKNRDFLSDTVLCSYFTSSITPESYLSLIFNANAPVSKKVWNVVSHLELSASTMSVLNAAQSANTISPRTAKVSQMALTKAERSYTIMHKSLSLLMDSSVTHVKDSLAALIIMNDQGDVQKQLIELDLDFEDYNAAKLKINDYVLEGTAEKTAFGNYKNLYLNLVADSVGLHSLEANQSARNAIGAIAADASHPCMIEARDLLKAVLGVNYTELKLVPSESLGGRMAKASSSVNDPDYAEIQSALAGAISMFPNPATQEVFIQNASIFDYQMKIFTVTGQLLFEGPVKASQLSKIETESFNDGIYFVNLYQAKLLIKTNKLIIAK
jgi:hypothetical protein